MESMEDFYFEDLFAAQHLAKSSKSKTKRDDLLASAESIKASLPLGLNRAVTLASEKGAKLAYHFR